MAAILVIAIYAAVCAAGVFVTFRWYLPVLVSKNTICEEEDVISLPAPEMTKNFQLLILVCSIIIGGVCGYWAYERCDEAVNIFKILLALGVLNVISITDISLYKIPNLCVITLLAGRCVTVGIEYFTVSQGDFIKGLASSGIALVVISLFLILMSIITRGGIGFGDVKIFGALGFLCGLHAVIYTLIFSFFLCAIASGVLLGTKKKHLKDGLPMGPFIWIGFAFVVVFGYF
jgi:leader peptidase (prepilin peptidase)/N-methyltransferase